MVSISKELMPSFSSTSLELIEEDSSLGFDDLCQTDTSSSPTSIHSASSVPNLVLPTHPYFTRLAVKRFKTAGTPHPSELWSTDSKSSKRTIHRLRSATGSTPSCSRTNSNFLSRSLSSLSQNSKHILQNWGEGNDSSLTLFLPKGDLRAVDMDLFPACPEDQSRISSNPWKMFFTVLSLCFIGYIAWNIILYFQTISTELTIIKDQIDRMKFSGGSAKYRKNTNRKLDMIENHLFDIRKSQESTCLAGDRKDSLSLKVRTLVEQALDKYSADKTGRTDFALEASGGIIEGTYETEPYDPTAATLFGIQICQGINGPRAVIQASVLPGECWSFKGNKGSVVIKLLGYVFIDGVSLEHISRSISPSGEIDTAPKDFSIWGLDKGQPGEGEYLGRFRYDVNGETLQSFAVELLPISYQYIHFVVHSNHGNPTFTCVYRLRVHGTLDKNSFS